MSDPDRTYPKSRSSIRALGVPEILFAFGVLVALVHFVLAKDVGLRAAEDMNIGPAMLYLFVPIGGAVVLLKVRPLARLALGYFAGVVVFVILAVVIRLIRGVL